MKKLANTILGRFTIVALSIIVQVIWLAIVLWQFSYQFTSANFAIRFLAMIVVLAIVNKWTNPEKKLSWTFLILVSPVFGLLVYFLFGRSNLTKKTEKKMLEVNTRVEKYLNFDKSVDDELMALDPSVARQSQYIRDWAGFPLYKNTVSKYYRSGEEMFPDMLEAIRSAQSFIFMEFFIIEDGLMLGEILEILEQKALDGVDIRIIYDDVGSINTLPANYAHRLTQKGIKCVAFNPFRPIISVVMNNRDHRKIFVVDGHTGFTGGINIADEYINEKERFGYWKDTGVKLVGDAVTSLTAMFLEMWDYIAHENSDYESFMKKNPVDSPAFDDGFIQPYGDSPLDHENVGENIYLNIISRAKKYVYIFTPYLIIDNELMEALKNTAKSGVDVRIVTPGIPDKKTIFLITQSYYKPLIESGVRIYEYTPGFIHAKSFVCDDEIATVGSINLDFRSLYLHFECGVFMYKSAAVMQVKEDCLAVFKESRQIPLEFCTGRNIFVRMIQSVMRLFAPLL